MGRLERCASWWLEFPISMTQMFTTCSLMKASFTFTCLLLLRVSTLADVDRDALPDVEEGFEVNFFVREPHLINPSSLCFDAKGRLYVGAGPQYRHPKEDSPTDYIKILIDGDGDGEAETIKTLRKA